MVSFVQSFVYMSIIRWKNSLLPIYISMLFQTFYISIVVEQHRMTNSFNHFVIAITTDWIYYANVGPMSLNMPSILIPATLTGYDFILSILKQLQ